jgi:catechol 2,3-dioxygenase-like lactoylglutathione lyase family enzyme
MDEKALLNILRTLEVALHQPHVRADAIRLAQLLHPSFRELSRSGREYSRDEVLAEFATDPQAYEVFSQDYQLEQLAPGLALLTYRSAHIASDGTLDRHTLRVSLWQLTDAGWQLRFHQGTPTDRLDNSLQAAPKFEAVAPRLAVVDIEEALAYYVDRLGFQLGWKWGNPPSHASVCRDAISLDLIADQAARCGTAMAYIQLRGVNAYYSELQARKVASSELGDRAYGMRDFEVVDPWGNRLAFGESIVT